MLERSGSGKSRSLAQLPHQLPRVQGIEQVDIARTAIHHFNGQLTTVGHKDARRLLIRIASVLQC